MNYVFNLGSFFDRNLKISSRFLIFCAYFYMICPIVIFFLGYLRLPFGILFSALLVFGFGYHMRKNYSQKECFEVKLSHLILIALLVLFWIFMSGIGGFTFQRWDHHFRNAVLRDLVEFSWPVVYPETGNSLVYYFGHWILPAFFGKFFGYAIATSVLYVWSSLGIFITILLLLKLFEIKSVYKILALCLMFFFFSFPSALQGLVKDIFAGTRYQDFLPYSFTSHTGGIDWAYNQFIAPLVALSIFLNEKKTSSLALTGLCVLPFAPFPFVGIFLLFVCYALAEFVKSAKSKKTLAFFKEVCSVPNLSAIFSILIVFAFFYACNTASNGSDGRGGLSLNIPEFAFNAKKRFLFWLFIFYFFNIGIFGILTFKENKKNPLFYVSIVSLMFLPFIQIGTSQDFCWRSTISANFVIFSLLAHAVLSKNGASTFRKYAISCFFGLCLVSGGTWDFMFTTRYVLRNHFKPFLADSIYTFSDKILDGNWHYLNFIDTKPNQQFFFTVLAKKKNERTIQKDIEKTKKLQKERNVSLAEGRYLFSPKMNENLFLSTAENSKIPGYDGGKDLFLSEHGSQISVQFRVCDWDERDKEFLDTDKYHLAFYPENQITPQWGASRLDIPWGKVQENGGIGVCPPNNSDAQKFKIVREGDFFKILWNDYALTFDEEKNEICMKIDENHDSQLWKVQKFSVNPMAE